MSLSLYNTLTRSIEEFPEGKKEVKMYICGVSPYAPAHIGHARCYIFFDVIKRFLKHRGHQVYHVQNITDVADEIHKQAKMEGMPDEDLVKRYISRYDDVFNRLNVSRADRYPRTSENLGNMMEDIEDILRHGKGYQVDGGVYFKATESDFGELLGTSLHDITIEEILPSSKKRSGYDMELWEGMIDTTGSYESRWGKGRPGWNLQCYTMSKVFFDHPVDIHGGGADLIFPHHEGERLITKALEDCELSRFYLHVNFIHLDDKKMSKSLGNIVTLEEVFKKWRPKVIRFFLLSKHYREPMDYHEDAIDECDKRLERISNIERALEEVEDTGVSKSLGLIDLFTGALESDMHTEEALEVMKRACDRWEELLSEGGKGIDVHEVRELFRLFHDVLGIK